MAPWLGELGLVFLVGLILPIAPWLPLRPVVLVPLVATHGQPWLVALAASLGAVLGTVPWYGIAASAGSTVRVQRWLHRRWVTGLLGWLRGKTFLAVWLFALLPLPDQLISVAAGVERYPLRRMLLAFFLGRLPIFLALAYLGSTNRELLTTAWSWTLGVLKW